MLNLSPPLRYTDAAIKVYRLMFIPRKFQSMVPSRLYEIQVPVNRMSSCCEFTFVSIVLGMRTCGLIATCEPEGVNEIFSDHEIKNLSGLNA